MAGKLVLYPTYNLVLIANSAVSAFAARKAARRPIGDVTIQNEVQTSLVTGTQNDPLEDFEPPRKKQKRGDEPRNKSPSQPQQLDGSVNVPDGSIKHAARAMESHSESDSASGSEPSAHSMAAAQRFSTLDLSKSKVLSETETEWTVRLHPNDVSIWPIPPICCKI